MTQAYPLLERWCPDSVVAFHRGKRISAARFLGAAQALAVRLPHQRHVLNLCEDRYHFLLGFAAALQTGQVTLLPPNRAPEVLRRLCSEYPDAYCLADHHDLPEGLPVFFFPETHGAAAALPPPLIPAEQTAVIVFTSGSTGAPAAHPKNWASLVSVAQSLGRQLDFSPGASVLGTVPPQHSYGLETTVLLPLQWGSATHSARPLLPADIEAALAQIPPPRWLMTTPLHLRACVESGLKLPVLRGVLSATMPLSAQLARAVESLYATTVHDVYGCTEAGIIALRRVSRSATWRTLEGVRVSKKGDEAWVEGGHVPQPTRLADQISVHSAQEFELHGRMSDVVKIAGKRASLAALNAELGQISGIMDGVFYLPEAMDTAAARLTAFVVAPALSPEAILAELRKHIDPAFLPRPLYLVKALPRNAAGKLPLENLRCLASELARDHTGSDTDAF